MVNKGGEEKKNPCLCGTYSGEGVRQIKYTQKMIFIYLYTYELYVYILIYYLYLPIYLNLQKLVFMTRNKENGARGARSVILCGEVCEGLAEEVMFKE